MFNYDFYFRGIENFPAFRSQMYCLTDDEALRAGLERLAQSPYRSVEVWESGRRVTSTRAR